VFWEKVKPWKFHRGLSTTSEVLNATAICLTFAVFLFGLVVSQAMGLESMDFNGVFM
jgi:hypothetical protein